MLSTKGEIMSINIGNVHQFIGHCLIPLNPWIDILIDKVDRWIETGQVFGKENQLKCRNNYVLANI